MEETSDGGTFRTRYPKVAGPSIKDNFELLGWCTQSDGCVILRIHVVAERKTVATLDLFLSPEEIVVALFKTTTRTTTAYERGLTLRNTIFLGKVKGLELWVTKRRSNFVEFDSVNLCGRERKGE
jgi:hypothetical protein